MLCRGRGFEPRWDYYKEITQQYSVTSFFRNSAGSIPALHANVYALGSGFNTPLISETKQNSSIPHGLVVRIRAFHACGRGSIPRGGDKINIGHSNK
jgi:hypothetical protein